MTPNALAWIALGAWPLVVLAVYAARRSTSRPARTTAWMLLLEVMFLPAGLDLPFAALNKHRIGVLSVTAALLIFHRKEIGLRERARHFPLFALLVVVGGALQTVRTNTDPLTFGILRIPGLGLRDGAWMIYGYFVDMFLPFAIGQRVFRRERDLRDLLEVLSTCTLIYAPLCLLEMRLSPQFSNWVYGYFPHSFIQTMRGSGYRPVVFMSHGLAVAMFLFSGFCAGLALRQARTTARPSPGVRAMIAGVLLLAGRSLASIIYASIALLLHLFPSARARARLAATLGVLVLAYPTMRAYDLVPTADILQVFARVSTQRSASLMTRFDQEDKLLERAMKRPLYGWGGWGRNRIYSWWGERGDEWAGYRDYSITDGSWIIWLGGAGAVGFAASFALIVVPLLRYARRYTRLPPSSQLLVGALAVMVGLSAADLLPNSQFDYLPVVFSGALFTLSASSAQRKTGGPLQRSTSIPNTEPVRGYGQAASDEASAHRPAK